jgi:NADH-quinone oxidoreductase subunit J
MRSGDFDNDQRWPAAVVAIFLFGVLIALVVNAFGHDEIKLSDALLRVSRTGPVADSIFRNFVVPFEVVSMLLLAALVGAVVIARRD